MPQPSIFPLRSIPLLVVATGIASLMGFGSRPAALAQQPPAEMPIQEMPIQEMPIQEMPIQEMPAQGLAAPAGTASVMTVGCRLPAHGRHCRGKGCGGCRDTGQRPPSPFNCCPPASGATAYGGSPDFDVGNPDAWLNRPDAPGLYWIGPESHLRAPCPQLRKYLPGYYQPVYGGSLPRWYASAEYLALFRDPDETIPFASLGPGIENVVLSTAEFNADYQSGVRTVVGYQWNDHIRLEGSYFGSYEWSDLASVNNVDVNDLGGVGNLFSPFTGFGNPADPLVDYNTLAVIDHSSRMNNVEFNLRHRLFLPPAPFEASFLVGARYMNIDETFGYFTSNNTGDLNSVDVETTNDMIGLQLGVLGQFLLTPWAWLDWEIKGVAAHNSTGQRTVYVNDLANGAPNQTTGGRDEDTTTFLGETSLVFNYQVRPNWTFRLGYQAIWVSGVALAAENFETNLTTLTVGPSQLDHSSETVYHGFSIGMVFAR